MEKVWSEWWGFSAVRNDIQFYFVRVQIENGKLYLRDNTCIKNVRPSVPWNSKQFIFGHLMRNLITKYPGKIIIKYNEMLNTNKWQITIRETSNSSRLRMEKLVHNHPWIIELKSSFMIHIQNGNWKLGIKCRRK